MVWYMSKCNKCEAKYENEQVDLEVDKINSAQEQQQQQDDKKTPPTSNNKPNGLVKSELKNNDSWSFKKVNYIRLIICFLDLFFSNFFLF